MLRSRRRVFSSFGVPMSISYPRNLEKDLAAILPPGRERAPADAEPRQFRVERRGKAWIRATEDDGSLVAEGEDTELVFDILDSFIRSHVASQAPNHVFVHAGVVALDGVALLLPGPSMTGKSTLVAALLQAGATYLSDEYAVVNPDGTVVAYPRPISVRIPDTSLATGVDPASLGRVASEKAFHVGAVVLTEYRPGAAWEPERLTAGIGSLRVFAQTVTAEKRPEESLTAIRNALDGAVVLESPRGEAEELAPTLIAELKALAG